MIVYSGWGIEECCRIFIAHRAETVFRVLIGMFEFFVNDLKVKNIFLCEFISGIEIVTLEWEELPQF